MFWHFSRRTHKSCAAEDMVFASLHQQGSSKNEFLPLNSIIKFRVCVSVCSHFCNFGTNKLSANGHSCLICFHIVHINTAEIQTPEIKTTLSQFNAVLWHFLLQNSILFTSSLSFVIGNKLKCKHRYHVATMFIASLSPKNLPCEKLEILDLYKHFKFKQASLAWRSNRRNIVFAIGSKLRSVIMYPLSFCNVLTILHETPFIDLIFITWVRYECILFHYMQFWKTSFAIFYFFVKIFKFIVTDIGLYDYRRVWIGY
jgi:hypothetical protein